MILFNKKEKNEFNKAILEQMNRIATTLEKEKSTQNQISLPVANEDDVFDTESAKRTAAYALNLCLVSISQIIDYNDLYVLEQEYDGILNNLNLENIPKDEALLDILKQILDTITYFKLREEEKKIIEKEYQDNMKAAIWRAVPNFGIILATDEPIAMAVSLASQVGIGYMNYRKEKVAVEKEYEKKQWEIQRTAIEQFHGLRRELFTTAWRLAEKYKFPDAWRLTEKQIEQYNKILIDPNPQRRLESLEDIETKFEAYPPFWYYKGHTALEIANSSEGEIDTEMIDVAKSSFEKYFCVNDNNIKLLRCDEIYSACALEYIEMLDPSKKEEIEKFIKIAIENAGNKNDILQLCAMAYLSVGNKKDAANELRKLVREDYNRQVNAQVLSGIYIAEYLSKDKLFKYRSKYDTLNKISDGKIELMPWPDDNETFEEQFNVFVENRRDTFIDLLANYIQSYYDFKASQYASAIEYASKSELLPKDRETVFVDFITNMGKEISAINFIDFKLENYKQVIQDKYDDIFKWINEKKQSLSFNALFKNYFKQLCEQASFGRIYTLDLSEIEKEEIVLGKLYTKAAFANTTEISCEKSLAKFLEDKLKNKSPQFVDIKNAVLQKNIILSEQKTELLISDTARFNDYLRRHKLPESDNIIAIINDKSFLDKDLILYQDKLVILQWDSTLAKGIKRVGSLLFGLGGLVTQEIASAIIKNINSVSYNRIKFDKEKSIIKSPNYDNKEIDMSSLCSLIGEIQEICEKYNSESIKKILLDRYFLGKPMKGLNSTEYEKYCLALVALILHFAKCDGDFTENEHRVALGIIHENIDELCISKVVLNEINKIKALSNITFYQVRKYLDDVSVETLKKFEQQINEMLEIDNDITEVEKKAKEKFMLYLNEREKELNS